MTEARALEVLEVVARAFDHAAGPLSVHPSNLLVSDRETRLGEGAVEATRDLSVAVASLGATLAALTPTRSAFLEALLAKMRSADRRDRPQTPAELIADVAAVREGRDPAAPSRRMPVWFVAAVFAAIVAVGLLVPWLSRGHAARYIEQRDGKHYLVYRFNSRKELQDWFPAQKDRQPDHPDLAENGMAPGDASYWCTIPFGGVVELEAEVMGSSATVTVSVGRDGSVFFAKAIFGPEFVLKVAGMPAAEPVPLEWKGGGRLRVIRTAGQIEFFLDNRPIVRKTYEEPPFVEPPKAEDLFQFAVQGPARFGRIAVSGKILSSWFKK